MVTSIEKEFVPYQESLELKELGFDEPCFGTYDEDKNFELQDFFQTYETFPSHIVAVPTFSQAFDFFETKYGIYHTIWPEFYKDGINFNWQCLWYLPVEERTEHVIKCLWYLPVEERTDRVISGGTMQYGDNGEYPTRRLANIACINKMIEIVKKRLATQK